MALPIIDRPTYAFEIPSTGKQSRFRSMTIKEEKVLLVAKESNDPNDILTAIVQIVNNCSLDGDLKVEKLPLFDIEYLFLKIRAASVSNLAKMSFTESWEEDGETKTKSHDFEVDLSSIEMKKPELADSDRLVKVNDEIGIELQFPPVEMNLSEEYRKTTKEADLMDLLIRHSIKSIYDGDAKITDFSKEELARFVDSLPSEFFEKITNFLEKQPSLYHALEYKDHNGETQKIELTTLTDFFTF